MTLTSILAATAREYGVTVGAIKARRRTKQIAEARQVVMWLAWDGQRSSTATGRALDRDHTTVLHGAETIARRLVTDAALAERVGRIWLAETTHAPV